jgi:hypothetical protein
VRTSSPFYADLPVGSLVCALAPTSAALIVGRAIAGAGGAVPDPAMPCHLIPGYILWRFYRHCIRCSPPPTASILCVGRWSQCGCVGRGTSGRRCIHPARLMEMVVSRPLEYLADDQAFTSIYLSARLLCSRSRCCCLSLDSRLLHFLCGKSWMKLITMEPCSFFRMGLYSLRVQ